MSFTIDVGDYFQSIESVFHETLTSRKRTIIWQKLANVSIFLTVFSFLPILPYVAWKLLRSKYLQIYQFRLSLPALWMWWLVCAVVCLLALVLFSKLATRANTKRQKAWLSTPQVRFALSYAVANEIEQYQTNHLLTPIKKASEYETELWKSMLQILGSPFSRMPPPVQAEFMSEAIDSHLFEYNDFDFLRRSFPWFRLEPRAQQMLDGLRGFHSKIRDRIRDKKDLTEVHRCLLGLAAYLYTQIPELQPTSETEGTAFAQWGEQQLLAFADGITKLPAYASESERVGNKDLIKKGVLARVSEVTTVFSHENIFLCFLSWLVTLSVLVLFGTRIALHTFSNLKMDTVLVSTMVATPIIGAATLVAIARQRKKPD